LIRHVYFFGPIILQVLSFSGDGTVHLLYYDQAAKSRFENKINLPAAPKGSECILPKAGRQKVFFHAGKKRDVEVNGDSHPRKGLNSVYKIIPKLKFEMKGSYLTKSIL
jgi:hypothetical protein